MINKNIEYILDEVFARGFDEKASECNDFVILLQKKDFKDLIALELYETYFWEERHEFDLQILKEIVESVASFFFDPDTIMQIKTGILQTLPSTIIVTAVAFVWKKLKSIPKRKNSNYKNSSWIQIEKNIKNIDKEFSAHDYILTDEIEHVFDTSRDMIQPLLKLCGCKCYIDKKRSIWLKAGLSDDRINDILKQNHFRKKK